MRKDMSKVIVERPRLGRSMAGKKPGRTMALADDDGEPIRAKGAREPKKREQKTKWLNENLSPLKRYLARQVGRPWSKVYSEISENLKPSSTVQQHVRDHLVDFVAIKVRREKGELWADTRWGRPMPLSRTSHLYYVHPRTGLLRENEQRVTWKQAERHAKLLAEAELAKRMRAVDAKTQFHLLDDGAWWEVKLAKIPPRQAYVDVVRRAKLSKLSVGTLYDREGVYAHDKRQLSKAEMKLLKLR